MKQSLFQKSVGWLENYSDPGLPRLAAGEGTDEKKHKELLKGIYKKQNKNRND